MMSYCITLRSRTDTRITGWYVGSDGRYGRPIISGRSFSTRNAMPDRYALCPRNAEVINIKAVQDDLSLRILMAGPGSRSSIAPNNAGKAEAPEEHPQEWCTTRHNLLK